MKTRNAVHTSAFGCQPPLALYLTRPLYLDALQTALANQWIALDDSVKSKVKGFLLPTLGTSVGDVAHTVALVLAKVAAIELPRGGWPELIPSLINNAQPTAPGILRNATLQALGYVCEELGSFEEDFLDQETVNAVLTAVAGGMRPDETDMEVKLAATQALNNALEFASNNFGNEAERNYLMQVVCQGTLAEDSRARQASWECLVSIAELYYRNLPAYMQSVFELTQRAVRQDEEAVALQALEFWSTIAEEEADLEDRKAEEPDNQELICHNFVKTALPQLVPLLLEQLTKQEEDADEEGAWNVALAAGTALGLAAIAAGDPVVELVMPYVQENIQRNASSEDWRLREAATFAFGSILEGPQLATLGNLARPGLGFLLSALKDPHPQVKNTTAWTIGRIFEFVHGQPDVSPPLLGPQNLPSVIAALMDAVRDEAHVAEKACYALSQLAAGFGGTEPSPLAPYFKDIVAVLWDASSRHVESVDATRLHMQAFEAINEMVRASGLDAAPLVSQLIPVVTTKIMEATNVAPTGGEAAERIAELQGLLCGVIQVAVQKLTEGGDASRSLATAHADAVMQALLQVLTWRQGTISEEALLAVGAMTYACGRGFGKYLDAFSPPLLQALQQHADYQTCQVAVGLVGDVCRALEEDVFRVSDQLMLALLRNLQSDEVHRSIKPQILSAFGDVALAVGDRFDMYLAHVIQMLQSAATLGTELKAQAADEDAIDYVNRLRQGIMEAWAGMLNGMSRSKVDQYLKNYAPHLIELAESIAADGDGADPGALRAAVALLGDVASSLPGVGAVFHQKPGVVEFLRRYAEEQGPLGDTAKWALQAVLAARSG
jgi:importin subunit beta-1